MVDRTDLRPSWYLLKFLCVITPDNIKYFSLLLDNFLFTFLQSQGYYLTWGNNHPVLVYSGSMAGFYIYRMVIDGHKARPSVEQRSEN